MRFQTEHDHANILNTNMIAVQFILCYVDAVVYMMAPVSVTGNVQKGVLACFHIML